MMLYRKYSKQQLAAIFGVNRSTVYSWESRGLPVRPPERSGRPAKVDFEEALSWYLINEEIKGTSEEGLEILEKTIRERKAKYYG